MSRDAGLRGAKDLEKDGSAGNGRPAKHGIAAPRFVCGRAGRPACGSDGEGRPEGARLKGEVAAHGPFGETVAVEEREMTCVLLSRGLRSSVRMSEDGEGRDVWECAVGTRMTKPVAQLTPGISGERSESAACRG